MIDSPVRPLGEVARNLALEAGGDILGVTECWASYAMPADGAFAVFVSFAAATGWGTYVSPPQLHVMVSAEGEVLGHTSIASEELNLNLEGFIPALKDESAGAAAEDRFEQERELAGLAAALAADPFADTERFGELFAVLVPRSHWQYYHALAPEFMQSLSLPAGA